MAAAGPQEQQPVPVTVSEPINIIQGHGSEENIHFSDRNVLKDGYTLVTFEEFGNPVEMKKSICPLNEIFSNESNRKNILALSNPVMKECVVNFFKSFGQNIRIYYSGDRYPELSVTFPYSWTREKYPATFESYFDMNPEKIEPKKAQAVICKSGVFSFPIPPFSDDSKDLIITKDCNDRCAIVGNLNEEEQKRVIQDAMKGSYSGIMADGQTKFIITKIMEILGPGIYIYPVCRALAPPTAEQVSNPTYAFTRPVIPFMRRQSEAQQELHKFRKGGKKDKKKRTMKKKNKNKNKKTKTQRRTKRKTKKSNKKQNSKRSHKK